MTQERTNYIETAVIHRQYRIAVPGGQQENSFDVVIPNPFVGYPGLKDGLDPEGDLLDFFPAKAGVFEQDPGGRFFLCKYDETLEQVVTTSPVDWGNDNFFAVCFAAIQNECVLNLTLWLPLKAANTRFYNVDAIPVVPPN